jgi:hypothetical protein
MVDRHITVHRRWRVAGYIFGGTLCLLAVGNLWVGSPWYLVVGVLCGATMIMIGQRRIFRSGVSRTPSEVVCRYIPWYEGSAYMLSLLLPLFAISMIAAGGDPDYPAWPRLAGIVLLCVMPLILWGLIRTWRVSVLRISPFSLTMRLATPAAEFIHVGREHVESIAPKVAPDPVNGRSLRAEITYHCPNDSGDNTTTETVLLGLYLTVRPHNLVNALITWKNATTDEEDPNQLLDRIEQILRGHSTANMPTAEPPRA